MSKSVNIVKSNELPQKISPKNKNYIDITNKRFGRLTALYPCGYLEKDNRLAWLCKCDCGNYIIVTGKRLRVNGTKSCGCLQRDKNIINNQKRGKEIKVGDRFGKLTVKKDLGFFERPNGKRGSKFLCDCDCGTKNIEIWGVYLNYGDTTSCGCMKSKGEQIIKEFLYEHNIIYKSQYIFKDLVSKFNNQLKFDFAIFNKNNQLVGLIEYQGIQHFEPIEFFGGEEKFQDQIDRDNKKKEYCIKNNISLYYINYNEDINKRMEEIINGIQR